MINELVGLPDTWDAGHGQIPSSCRSSWATVSKNTSEMFILAEIHAQVTQNGFMESTMKICKKTQSLLK